MTLLQIFFNCMTLGAIYALVAAGIVIVFKATELINFGAGDWVLGGAYIALALVRGHVTQCSYLEFYEAPTHKICYVRPQYSG